MAKKTKKAVKRTVSKTGIRKRSKNAVKKAVRKPISKKSVKTIKSPTKPLRKSKRKKSENALSSNYSLRSSARIKKLKTPTRSPSKRIRARSRQNSKKDLKPKKISKPSSRAPSKRHQEATSWSFIKPKNPVTKSLQTSLSSLSTVKRRRSRVKTEFESEEYEVEKICDVKCTDDQEMYLVKWMGYGVEHNTWEPKENLGHANGAINDFHEGHTYEVEFIVGKRTIGGQQQYRVRWKGWPPSTDTWEPRASLMKGAKHEVKRFDKIRKRRTA